MRGHSGRKQQGKTGAFSPQLSHLLSHTEHMGTALCVCLSPHCDLPQAGDRGPRSPAGWRPDLCWLNDDNGGFQMIPGRERKNVLWCRGRAEGSQERLGLDTTAGSKGQRGARRARSSEGTGQSAGAGPSVRRQEQGAQWMSAKGAEEWRQQCSKQIRGGLFRCWGGSQRT